MFDGMVDPIENDQLLITTVEYGVNNDTDLQDPGKLSLVFHRMNAGKR